MYAISAVILFFLTLLLAVGLYRLGLYDGHRMAKKNRIGFSDEIRKSDDDEYERLLNFNGERE